MRIIINILSSDALSLDSHVVDTKFDSDDDIVTAH